MPQIAPSRRLRDATRSRRVLAIGRVGTRVRMLHHCARVAIANLAQQRMRLAVAVCGTGVALLLLLLQLSFLESVRAKASAVYDLFDFDIAIVPAAYQILFYTGSLDRVRLAQVRSANGVADAAGLNIGTADWTALPSRRISSLLVLGIDDRSEFVRDPSLRAALAGLVDTRSVVIDDLSGPGFGSLRTGTAAEIGGRRVVVSGHFSLGLSFYADGCVLVRNSAFGLLTGRPAREFAVGLVRLSPRADPAAVKAELIAVLPDDLQVYLRDELIKQERDFFTSTKPIGVMLHTGMVIAFLVGATILYQVLSTEISRRLKETALLKAMGFSPSFIYGIGVMQVSLLSAGGLVLAAAVALPLLWFVKETTHLPTELSIGLVLVGAAAALAMSIASAAIVLRRVQRADPASLF